MRTRFGRICSCLAASALVAALVLTSGGIAVAAGPASNGGPTLKVLIVNAEPGDVVSAYDSTQNPSAAVGRGSQMESVIPVPASGQVEFFIPTTAPNVIYVWGPQMGYRLLRNVAAGTGQSQIVLDASKAR